MWAGGRLEFLRPLRVGEKITRTSHIAGVQHQEGRSGPLVFVLVRHEIAGDARGRANGRARHRLPGHSAAEQRDNRRARQMPPGSVTIHPDDVLLFRYSALTFNGHRIHYDRRYATEVEGYPGLVVHGPLIATLLIDLIRRHLPEASVDRFSFRAVSPIFDTAAFSVCGKPEGDEARLWAKTAAGALAMTAAASVSR